ncbi:MAG: hypothetical protein ACM3PZ_00010 [Bacillota bacterium]
MLVKDFIKGPLLDEIEDMTMGKNGVPTHSYLGFQLIATAIEFLGACLDQYEWDERNMSEKRFKLAIKELFDKKYHQYNNGGKFDLYSNLRCSLVHSSRPGNNIGLSEYKNNAVHLHNNGSLTLVFEEFLNDFKSACNKTIKLIDNNLINNNKVYNHVIFVPQDYKQPINVF